MTQPARDRTKESGESGEVDGEMDGEENDREYGTDKGNT